MATGLAIFSGSAASAADESNQRWRALWQADQERKQREQQFSESMAFQKSQAQRAEEFQLNLERMRQEWNAGQADSQRQYEQGKWLAENIGNMDIGNAQGALDWLSETGNSWLSFAQSSVRTNLFKNPAEAWAYLDSVYQTPVGQRISIPTLNLALDAAGSMGGIDPKELERIRKDYLAFAQARNSGAEEVDTIALEQSRTALNQAQANLVQTEAETANLDARTQAALQDMGFQAEQHPLIMQNLALVNSGMTLDNEGKLLANDALRIQNEYLPDQIQAALDKQYAETRSVENGNRLFELTLDDTVRTIKAQANISEEEARHLVATANARDAIVNGEVDRLQASIALLNSQKDQTDASAAQMRVQTDAISLSMVETRATIAQQLVEWGRADMLQAIGADLFQGMGFTEEEQANLISSLSETAKSNADLSTRRDIAAVQVAEAQAEVLTRTIDTQVARADEELRLVMGQADYQEWQNSVAESQRQFENDLAERGMRVNERQVEGYLRSLMLQSKQSGAGAGTVPITTAIDETRKSTGISLGDANQHATEWGEAQAAAEYFERLLASPEANAQEISRLTTEYGFSEGNHQQALQHLYQTADNLRNKAVQDVYTYVTSIAGMTGRIPTPEELGITADRMALYDAAVGMLPGVREAGETERNVLAELPEGEARDRVTEVWNYVTERSELISGSQGADGILLGGASVMYDNLLGEFGAERLQEAGIYSPSDVVGEMGQISSQMAADRTLVNQAMERTALITGGENAVNLDDPQSVENFVDTLTGQANAYLTFQQELNNLPKGNGFLGIGPGPEARRLAALRLLSLMSNVASKQELVEAGVIQTQGIWGDVAGLDPEAASAFLGTLISNRYAEAAAVRRVAAAPRFE